MANNLRKSKFSKKVEDLTKREKELIEALKKTFLNHKALELPDQTAIGEKMAKYLPNKKEVKQDRVSEILNLALNLGLILWEKTDFGYQLQEKGIFDQKLDRLKEHFDWTSASCKPVFESNVRIGILKTHLNHNSILAQEIEDTFKGIVVSIFCPNKTDVVIYYKEVSHEERKNLEVQIMELCKNI